MIPLLFFFVIGFWYYCAASLEFPSSASPDFQNFPTRINNKPLLPYSSDVWTLKRGFWTWITLTCSAPQLIQMWRKKSYYNNIPNSRAKYINKLSSKSSHAFMLHRLCLKGCRNKENISLLLTPGINFQYHRTNTHLSHTWVYTIDLLEPHSTRWSEPSVSQVTSLPQWAIIFISKWKFASYSILGSATT